MFKVRSTGEGGHPPPLTDALSKNRFHGQRRMAYLLQEGMISSSVTPCSSVAIMSMKFGNPDFLAALEQPFANFFLEHLRHPDQPFETAITDDELALGDVVLAVAHKTRGHVATADGARPGS